MLVLTEGVRTAFELRGVNAAFTTPFNKDESIDEKALRKDIKYLVKAGVHGLVSCSTPGEMVLMTNEERKRVIQITVEESDGVPVIAECGCARTNDAVDMAKYAQDAGASAVMALTPWFYPQHPRDLLAYYEAIADAVEVPIIIYNLPKYTGVKIDTGLVSELASNSNIHGFKDTSGDLIYFQELMEKAGDHMNFVMGADELVLPALAVGATGCITAMAACVPEMVLDLYNSFMKKDIKHAQKIQLGIIRLKNVFRKMPYLSGQKLAQETLGRPSGLTRMPLGRVTDAERDLIKKEIKKLGLV